MDHADLKVHGVLPLNNYGGLEISVADDAENVFWRDNYGNPGKWHRAKIYFPVAENGSPYFIVGGRRIHIDEILRAEGGTGR